MILYARQLGWFHSTPTPAKSHKKISDQERQKTRLEKIVDNGGTPLMPDVGEAVYLVNYWNDLGLFEEGQMGPVGLSAQEVSAWQSCTELDLNAWEYAVLVQMSRAYLTSMRAGAEPECPPPFGDPVNEFDRATLSKRVSNAFKSLLMARKS